MKDLTLSADEAAVMRMLQAGRHVTLARFPCPVNNALESLRERGYVAFEPYADAPDARRVASLTDAGRLVEVSS